MADTINIDKKALEGVRSEFGTLMESITKLTYSMTGMEKVAIDILWKEACRLGNKIGNLESKG